MECKCCENRKRQIRAIRLRKHASNKAIARAMRQGIDSGRISVLYLKDEITGLHFRPCEWEHLTGDLHA